MTYRHPLTPAEQRAHYRRHMQKKQDAMTPAEIGRAMRKVAHEALDRTGAVSGDDFVRANIPSHAIATRGMAIIAEVLDERANGGINASGPPLPVLAMNWGD